MPVRSTFRLPAAGVLLTAALLSGAGVAHASTTPTSGTATVTSATTHAKLSTVRPKITGKHKVGHKLRAVTHTWKPAPVVLHYVWKRSGERISGADHRTYTVRPADRGHKLTVSVTGIKPGYTKVRRTSPAIIIPKRKASTSSHCDPNYSPCVPIASDVDCAGGSGNGPAYVQGPVRVIGRDIYGLDYDGDGVGCE